MHRVEEQSDESLIKLAARGEAQSFSALAGRYRTKSLRIAYGVLHNPADAEDAVQNAFVRVYQNLSRLRRSGNFRSWLYRIVLNESIRLLRSRSRPDEAGVDVECVASNDVDPAQVLLVRQCLASLPERLRTVLALRAVEELDYAEIGEILDVPVGTVRSRLHEARKLFAKHWREAMNDDM